MTPTTTYSSDRSIPRGSLRFRDLNGTFSDADIALSFMDDGRLSGVNATSTGEGNAIIKDVITFATAVAPLVAFGIETKAAQNVQKACEVIVNYGDGKPVTLIYIGTLFFEPADPKTPSDLSKVLTLEPDPGSATLYDQLHNIYPKLAFSVRVTTTGPADGVASYAGQSSQSSDVVLLELNKFAIAALEVVGPDSSFEKDSSLWKSEIPVPLREPHYFLPIPKAALFGK